MKCDETYRYKVACVISLIEGYNTALEDKSVNILPNIGYIREHYVLFDNETPKIMEELIRNNLYKYIPNI